MQLLRNCVFAIALSVAVAGPAHAVYGVQYIPDPTEIERDAGVGFFGIVSEIYATVASLESGTLPSADARFDDLRDDLVELAALYDELADSPPTSEGRDRPSIDPTLLGQAQETLAPDSYSSWALGLTDPEGPQLSMPNTDTEVFSQGSVVLRALAEKLIEAGSLRSQGAEISDVVWFRALNFAVSEAVNVLAILSILLSTSR